MGDGVDEPLGNFEFGEFIAELEEGLVGEDFRVGEKEEVGLDLAAGFDEGAVGSGGAATFAAGPVELAGEVGDGEGVGVVSVFAETGMNLLIAVGEGISGFVEVEVDDVNDPHGVGIDGRSGEGKSGRVNDVKLGG